jgi:hypothetical protein
MVCNHNKSGYYYYALIIHHYYNYNNNNIGIGIGIGIRIRISNRLGIKLWILRRSFHNKAKLSNI